MNTHRQKSCGRIMTVLVCIALGGCALSNPYVKVPTVDDATTRCGDECSISEAQAYSRSVREAYRERLGVYAKVRNNTGAAAIVLGAIGLGLGAADAHRDALVGVGLTGATTYGLATWFGNTPLEALYANAIVALQCAEVVVEPLRLVKVESDDLSAAMNILTEHSPLLTAAVLHHADLVQRVTTEYLAWTQRKANDPPLSPAQKQRRDQLGASLDAAQAAAGNAQVELTRASSAYAKGVRLRHVNAVAGNQLARAVEHIVAVVDEEARKDQPEVSAALKIVADLGGLAGKIVPGLDISALLRAAVAKSSTSTQEKQSKTLVTGGPNPTPSPLEELERATADITSKTQTLAGASTRIEALTAQVQSVDTTAAFGHCAISGASALSVVPDALALVKGVNSVSFIVSGGKAPYSATLVGPRPDGLVVINPISGDRRFDLTTTAATPAGTYALSVSDATMNSVSLAVVIAAANTAKSDAGGNGGSGQSTPPPASAPTAAQINAAVTDVTAVLTGKAVVGTAATVATVAAPVNSVVTITVTPAPNDPAEASSLIGKIGAMPMPSGDSVSTTLQAVGLRLSVAAKTGG